MSGQSRVMDDAVDDAEGSLSNAIKLWALCVIEFLFDAILPAHVPESPTNKFSAVV